MSARSKAEAWARPVDSRHGFLLSLGDRLRSVTDPQEVPVLAAEIAGRHLEVARAGYGEIDSSGELVKVQRDWTNGTVASLAGEGRILDAFGPAVIAELRAGRTLIVEDCLSDPRSAGQAYAETWASIGTRALIVVPLVREGGLKAIFYLHEPRPRIWQDSEALLATDVAERTWDALIRAQAEQRLRSREVLHRQILNSASDYAIISKDLEGRITSWNAGARRVLGWAEDEILGQSAARFFTPEDVRAGQVEQEMKAALEQGMAADERWHVRKDGSRFWASGELTPLKGDTGQVVGFVKVLRDRTEQRKAVEALRRYELIVENMTEGVSLSRSDGTIVYTNPAEDRMFGYAPGELIGQSVTIQNAYPEAENERVVAAVIERLKTFGSWEGEWHNRRKDGSTFITASRINAVEVNGVPHWLCVQRDVTEAKRAEAALRESEERLRISQATGGVGSFELFPATGRMVTSEQFCRLWGVPIQHEFDVADLIACIHPEDQPRVMTGHRELPKDALGYIEYRVIRLDTGETRWIARQAEHVEDKDGSSRYLGVIYDITSRKKAEEQVRFQAQLLDSVHEAVIATDPSGRVIYWNRFAESLYGWSAQEALGGHILDLTSGSDKKAAEDTMALLKGGGSWSGEFTGRRRDGTTFPAHVTDAPVYDANGTLIGIVGISYDITPAKRAQERQQLLINELNHRVKNTLATVQSIAAQTLRNAPPAQAREAFEARLIALARAHDVLTRENWEGAGLHEIVVQALAPYRSHGAERFEVHGPEVRLTPRMALALAMALQELATNAVKYGALSNTGGRVHLTWLLDNRITPPNLQLRWEEKGGPPVQPPTRRGFGSRLLERSLAQDLGGEVQIKFQETGAICIVTAPVRLSDDGFE